MIKDGKILGKFNLIDGIILFIIFVLIIAVFMVKKGLFNPVSKIAKDAKPVEFTIVTRTYDITSKDELFKIGEKTFITIRNVPYTALEIVDVEKTHLKEMFFNYDRPEIPYVIPNVAYPYRYQYKITLKDFAQITTDGAVIGGNKIKIGLPVDLEGFNYRLGGSVTDIKIIEE